MGHESFSSWRPEAPAYADLDHIDLIGDFLDTQDPNMGRALSARLFAHAGLEVDPYTTPLRGRDGTQVEQDGRSLVLADYVGYAAEHHGDAMEEILGFLLTDKKHEDYISMQAAISDRLNPTAG
jgi:hypothetical protein